MLILFGAICAAINSATLQGIPMKNISELITEFTESRNARGRSERTIEWYTQQLNAYASYVARTDADAYEPETIEAFMVFERRNGTSDSTVHARYRALRAFFKWLGKRTRRNKESFDNPVEYIDSPNVSKKKPKVANADNLRKLIASIGSNDFQDIRDKFTIRLLWSTGVRVDEACHLELCDVDIINGFVMVRSGKGGKDRICPFDESFKTAYVEYIFNRPSTTCNYLLLTCGGHVENFSAGLQANGVRQMLRRRCADAGIPLVNPHSIRHLYAIERLNNGMQLSAVSAAMGHSSVSFTASHYAKWLSSGLRREYDNASRNLSA